MTSTKTHQNKKPVTRPRIKIATYSISLNEEKHIKRWLEATKESDYRVVFDTGSTDKTVELLKAAGVIIEVGIISPWRFDHARNRALDLIPEDADVCLILDMDEVPEKNFYKKVRKQWVLGADRGWIQIDTGFKWRVDRLHSRHNWKWKWPCHEVAMWQLEREYVFCETNAYITHQPDNEKSRGQYLTMLQEACDGEFAQDARMWTYLTREYYFKGNWKKVIESAEKAITFDGWDVELAAICRWAGDASKNLHVDPTDWFDRGVSLCPQEGEPWLAVASQAFREHKWQKGLDAAIQVIETPKMNHYLHDPSAWEWKAYDLAAGCAYNLGYLDEAITFGREALKGKGPESERIKRNLVFMEGLKNNATLTQTQSNRLGNE